MSHCPYCSLTLPHSGGDVYCSRKMDNFEHLENGLFLIKGQDIHSESHLSRFALRFIVHGSLNFTIDRQRYKTDAKSVLIFNENASYILDSAENQAASAHVGMAYRPGFIQSASAYAFLGPDYLTDNPQAKMDMPANFAHQWPESRQSRIFRNAMYNFIGNGGSKDQLVVNELAFRLLHWYIAENARYTNLAPKLRGTIKLATRLELVQRTGIARELVEYAPPGFLNVGMLAKESALSEFHFIRLYSQLYGISPYQHILEKRMGLALRLLGSTVMPINEVAAQCGYTDHTAFSRAFRKTFHKTPQQARHMR